MVDITLEKAVGTFHMAIGAQIEDIIVTMNHPLNTARTAFKEGSLLGCDQ
jgi:leucyl aminopeptidase (aminopeptidase T)